MSLYEAKYSELDKLCEKYYNDHGSRENGVVSPAKQVEIRWEVEAF